MTGYSVSGEEQITLVLSVNSLSFIISGLRDCADQAEKDVGNHSAAEDKADVLQLITENRETADDLEKRMMSQLGYQHLVKSGTAIVRNWFLGNYDPDSYNRFCYLKQEFVTYRLHGLGYNEMEAALAQDEENENTEIYDAAYAAEAEYVSLCSPS